jgi:hypothetical protein
VLACSPACCFYRSSSHQSSRQVPFFLFSELEEERGGHKLCLLY